MKRKFFSMMAKLNKVMLPSFAKKDLTRLTKFEKAIVGYRYYITKNALDKS